MIDRLRRGGVAATLQDGPVGGLARGPAERRRLAVALTLVVLLGAVEFLNQAGRAAGPTAIRSPP